MQMLFELDTKNYNENGTRYVRPSVRGIIIHGGRIAMIHSLKYDYYKFPGGGAENGESTQETLIREVKEEAGLRVIPESIREYGFVHRIQKGKNEDIFEQDNYYYLCQAESEILPPQLDDYEAEESFKLEFVSPEHAISVNRDGEHGPKDPVIIEREARVLEMLVKEGYFEME
jgi:8-oxo-dGTP pyrophosphatase MutT (NUDIX family)